MPTLADELRATWGRLTAFLSHLRPHEGQLDDLVSDAENAGRSAASSLAPSIVTPYDQLPQAPTPEPPTITSLDALRDEETAARFSALEDQLRSAIEPLGYSLRRRETRRTAQRQEWVWQIGRSWQAPGRTGIVTNVRTAKGPHPEGRAVDYGYVPGENAQGPDALHAALSGVAATNPDFTWGGSWASLKDAPHWEVA